ncbi:hypothetical protein [Aestuariibacter salexigens]|uniref:hypothetical protein n=1 Tax=Aestuariibacter salexigens TaxID=226010 RepID=UPI000553705F|nr:hypothetical protein [Aestuariibacter salexigens]
MKRFILHAALLVCCKVGQAQVQVSERLEVSGFARIVGGYLDTDLASYEGYHDSFSLSEQSLLGLQAEFSVTDKLTLVAQGLLHSGEERDSGIEWLYLNFEPSQHVQLKAGKLRTPFFNYSDVLDVGFAYPWITPPQQTYSSFLFSTYEGVSATLRFPLEYFSASLEGYYGTFEDELLLTGTRVYTDIKRLNGLVLNLQGANLNFRGSYHQTSDLDVNFAELGDLENIIRGAGFERTADSLAFDAGVQVFQLSASYNDLSYFGSVEWMRIATDVLLSPEVDSYYITAGFHYYPFQFYATFANSDISYRAGVNEIPVRLVPELDQLRGAYDFLLDARPVDNLESLSFGARWDISASLAMKFEWTALNGNRGERSFYETIERADFSRNANLYQVALEWVF